MSKSKKNTPVGLTSKTLVLRALMGLFILGGGFLLSQPDIVNRLAQEASSYINSAGGYDAHGGTTKSDAKIAPLFTGEVLYWQEDIRRWGGQRGFNPNLIATIIQIESCGDPYVASHAGAQGLFQVMPFHFEDGENQLDPEKNAMTGLDHLVDCLIWSDYDVGLAFACYNGGPSVIGKPQNQWPDESRAYYAWGRGIYHDAENGQSQSNTLTEWLAAGGERLCQAALANLDAFSP